MKYVLLSLIFIRYLLPKEPFIIHDKRDLTHYNCLLFDYISYQNPVNHNPSVREIAIRYKRQELIYRCW
jgi:hypothetical protein